MRPSYAGDAAAIANTTSATAAKRRMTEVMTPVVALEEEELEQTLRPRRLDEFVGQERIKEQLAIVLEAAKARDEALDHVLLVGPPGLGKTSLAYIVREELGVGIRCVAGPALERKGDMAAILTGLERHDVLFVDEIHRLNRAIEEILYPALEDFRLDIVVGQGPAARTLTLDLPPFTLVGATNETARRSRGTPRIANRILRRVRDVAQVRHRGTITNAVAQEALELLEVDDQGLERIDRELLGAIALRFGGGPVGLSTLAVALGEEPDTIADG